MKKLIVLVLLLGACAPKYVEPTQCYQCRTIASVGLESCVYNDVYETKWFTDIQLKEYLVTHNSKVVGENLTSNPNRWIKTTCSLIKHDK
jgi:hypothetical protein